MKTPTPHPSADRFALPLRVCDTSKGWELRDEEDNLIARAFGPRETADEVVTCCNSHSALVAALEEAAEFVRAIRDMTKPPGRITETSYVASGLTLRTAAGKLDYKLQAALALASSTIKEGE